ncbi:MAG: SGNH/GDSL hydrolase family protein [Oscillospiraceae bacterium]|nr:SGNH/GDSL hydrolase family protein [Oscillospiraceae bacterium]
MFINKASTIVFQGDSITAGNIISCNENSLGDGYVFFIDTYIKSIYPEYDVNIVNKGVDGDSILNLKKRWKETCVNLHPDIITLLIGINDIWDKYYSDNYLTDEEFLFHYDDIICDSMLNGVKKIVLMEPFIIPVNSDMESWRKDIYSKIDIVRRLAKKYNCTYIPLDSIFGELCTIKGPEYWSNDGIHPNVKGHFIIARSWLQMMNAWI